MLKGHTAIITGGSRGIGAAVTKKLASMGADVAVIYAGSSELAQKICPIDLNKQQFSSIHSKNENITIQNIGQCVLFYKDFIQRI